MAGNELPPAVAKFIADTADYLKGVRDMIAENEALNASIDHVHDLSVTANAHTEKAKVQLDALAAKADKLGKKKEDITVKARAMGFAQAALAVTGLDAVMQKGGKDAGLFSKILLGVNLATGVLEPAVAGLTVAAGGLAAGVASAGLGLGAFAVVAKGVFAQVTPAIQKYTQAQQAAQTATSATAKAADLAKMKTAFNGLDAAQKQMAKSMMSVTDQWHSFLKTATPGVAQVMNSGIKLLPTIFGLIGKFLPSIEAGLQVVIGQVGTALKSPFWQHTIQDFATASGPALIKIADAVGNIIKGVVGLLHAFIPTSMTILDGVDRMTAAFARWGTTITGHTGFQSLMQMAKQDGPLAISILKNLVTVLFNVGRSMTGLSTFANSRTLLQTLLPLSSILASLSKNQGLMQLALYAVMAATALNKLKTTVTGLSALFGASSGIGKTVTGTMNLVKGMRSAEAAASEATGAWGTFGGKLSGIGPKLKGIGSAVAGLGSQVASAASSALSFAGSLTKAGLQAVWAGIQFAGMAVKTLAVKAAQLAVAAASKVWAAAQAVLDIALDANPISLIVIAIAALVAGIVWLVVKCKPFRDFWIGLWHDVQAIVGTAVEWIKGHWRLIVGILTGPVGIAVMFIVDHWKQISKIFSEVWSFIVSLTKSVWGALVSYIRFQVDAVLTVIRFLARLPGDFYSWFMGAYHAVVSAIQLILNTISSWESRILGLFRSVGSWLYNVGRNLVVGFINGVVSMFGAVAQTAWNLVQSLGSSVLKLLGIGSPSKVAHFWGSMVAQGLVSGLTSGQGAVANAAGRLAASVNAGLGLPSLGALSVTAGAGAAGIATAPVGGGGGDLVVQVDGRELLRVLSVQAYRYNVRNSGSVTGVLKPS